MNRDKDLELIYENMGRYFAGHGSFGWGLSYYLETYIDGKQLLGSDGTTVFKSLSNVKDVVRSKIRLLRGLSRNVKQNILNAKSIVLKITDNTGNIFQEFDVTDKIIGNSNNEDSDFQTVERPSDKSPSYGEDGDLD